jgi:hypothetical protein
LTGVESREFRVVASWEDFRDVGVAEPVTLFPLDRIAIHVMEEDLPGFLGGLRFDDDFGVLAGVTTDTDLPVCLRTSASVKDFLGIVLGAGCS